MTEILQHNFKTEKPVSIFTTKIIDANMNDLMEKEIKKTGDVQDHKTNVKAYMTHWSMNDKPGFETLEKYILEVCQFLNKKYYNKTLNMKLDNLWGMIFKKGDHALVHDHWPALWSGVYYIKAPENSGDLTFPQLKQRVTPQDNMMVIFDGSTRHGVAENLSQEERIAVSFNVKEII